MKTTRAQATNRKRLVDYLLAGNLMLPFNMEVHCYDPLGHALHIGVVKKAGEEWAQFAVRAFGWDCNENPEAWQYLFGANWANADNTPQGAAHRIRKVNEGAIPPDWRRKLELAIKA